MTPAEVHELLRSRLGDGAVELRAELTDPAIVVRADRPFLYVLTDVSSGAVLFMGRVADPAAG